MSKSFVYVEPFDEVYVELKESSSATPSFAERLIATQSWSSLTSNSPKSEKNKGASPEIFATNVELIPDMLSGRSKPVPKSF